MSSANQTILLNVTLPAFLTDYKHRVLSQVEVYEHSLVKVFSHIHSELIQHPTVFDALLTVLGSLILLFSVVRFLEYARSAKRGKPGSQLLALRTELQKTRGELDSIRKLMNQKPPTPPQQPKHAAPSQSPQLQRLKSQLSEQDTIMEKYEQCMDANNKLSEFFLEQFKLIFEEIRDMRKSMKSSKKSEANRSTYSDIQEVPQLRQASAIEPIVSGKKKKEEVNGKLNVSVVVPPKKVKEEVDSGSPQGKITPIKELETASITATTSERKSPRSAEMRRISPLTPVPDNKPTIIEPSKPKIEEKIDSDEVLEVTPTESENIIEETQKQKKVEPQGKPQQIIVKESPPPVIPVKIPQAPTKAPQVALPIPVIPPPPGANRSKPIPPPQRGSRPLPPTPQVAKQKPQQSKVQTHKAQVRQQAKAVFQPETVKDKPAVPPPSPPKVETKLQEPPVVEPEAVRTPSPPPTQPKPKPVEVDAKPKTVPPPPGAPRGPMKPPGPPGPRQNKFPPAPPVTKQQSIELPREVNEEQLLNFPESAHTVVRQPSEGLEKVCVPIPGEVPVKVQETKQPQNTPQETKQVEVPEEKIEKPKFKLPPPPPATTNRRPPPPPNRR